MALYRQWCKTPDAVLAVLPEANVFLTVTEVRRIIGGITGTLMIHDQPTLAAQASEPTREAATAPAADPADNLPLSKVLHSAKPNTPEGYGRGEAKPMPKTVSGPAAADPLQPPVFHVMADNGAVGRLIVDRRAGGPGLVLVAYAGGIAEVTAADLRIVGVE